jgi:hypothetical protein
MNHRSEIDRVLKVWMADGPAAIPDRVVDVVATRIAVQRQRRAWPFPGRTTMTTQIKLIAGLAAALVVAVVGYNLLPGRPGTGSPTTAPTPSAQPTPSPSVIRELPAAVLEAGRYRMALSFIDPGLEAVADVPAGWTGHPDIPAVTTAAGSNSGILISFMVTDGLFSDPCRWDLDGSGNPAQSGDVEVGPTVGDLVAALRANEAYTASAAIPVTIGGFDGQELELQLPGDDVIRGCDPRAGESSGDYFVFPDGFYAQGANSRWRLSIVDVEGIRLIIMVSIAEGVPAADIAAAEALVESIAFTP